MRTPLNYRSTSSRVALLMAVACALVLCIACNKKPNDQLVVQEVEARLFQDPALKASDIHVESHNASVTLKGTVGTEDEKQRAGQIVASLSDVRQLVNSLEVAPPKTSDTTPVRQPAPVVAAPPAPARIAVVPAKPPTAAATSGSPAVTNAGLVTTSWTDPIDRYLAGRPRAKPPSPLTGTGSAFESDGRQYIIDPRLIVAISGAETSFATDKCHSTPVTTTRNAWNWFWCYGSGSCGTDACINSPFDTWESGIKTVSKYVERNYVMKGLTDVRKIQAKYCTSGCQYWVPNVEAFMREMGGDPENLTIANPFATE